MKLLAVLSALSAVAAASDFCPTIFADLTRRQLEHFDSDVPFTIGMGAKHVPVLTLSEDGKTATIVVGNGDEEGGVWHPMKPSGDPDKVHWVTHILVKDQDGNVIVVDPIDPNGFPDNKDYVAGGIPPQIQFDVPSGVTEMTPYEFCNLHGLWVGETVAVPSTTDVLAETRATDATCGPKQWTSGSWESVHADLLRQQAAHYNPNGDAVFTEVDGKKHTPYITLDGAKGRVFVGVEGGSPIHPMIASKDGNVHWVTEIYIVDQDGTIVAMESLDPTDVSEATMEFDLSADMTSGGTTLKAYSYCNIHGLWEGPVVEVPAVEAPAVEDEVSPAEVGLNSASTSSGDLIGAVLSAAAAVAML
ncbi:hypothetical protein THAOC_28367 [Thalassiosira oceanica]|uniref:Desulfoferrodoxin ferrous iron-binding domain-containing protein n=1 Tax=Thalassiosira oceanica TaxID=159749 RepID=K0S0G4_THAOC|nr:hypothetical protein THAOC_28367 [Thalassiosira oceanica]|eukprot:EJK52372.1 hypothetical protein THAOC_28367 [Thalassiosira oceanica]